MYIIAPELILHLEIQSKYIGPFLESKFIDLSFFISLIIQSKYIGPFLESKFIDLSFFISLIKSKINSLNTACMLNKVLSAVQSCCVYISKQQFYLKCLNSCNLRISGILCNV